MDVSYSCWVLYQASARKRAASSVCEFDGDSWVIVVLLLERLKVFLEWNTGLGELMSEILVTFPDTPFSSVFSVMVMRWSNVIYSLSPPVDISEWMTRTSVNHVHHIQLF